MPSGAEFANAAVAVTDRVHTYNASSPDRLTTGAHGTDCSGLVVLAYHALLPGAFIPGNSADQARWCRDHGEAGIAYTTALHTPGALGMHGPNGNAYDGYGPSGHVVVFVGDGEHTIEARGTHFSPQVGI